MISRTICAACASGLLLTAGCGGASDRATPDAGAVDTDAVATSATVSGGINIVEPWARPADAGKNTAVYVRLENALPEGDSLTGVRSAAAERAELHASVLEGEMMRMRPVVGIALPSGGRLELRPMGTHVMLLRLRDPLVPGDTVQITFDFTSGRSVDVRAGVRTP